jgi:hypothetical protein
VRSSAIVIRVASSAGDIERCALFIGEWGGPLTTLIRYTLLYKASRGFAIGVPYIKARHKGVSQ